MTTIWARSILVVALFLTACEKHEKIEVQDSDIVLVDSLPEDFVVPGVVWKSMQPKTPEEKEKPIIYTSVKVFMQEKNKNVLKKPLIALEFPRGGGEIDLAMMMGAQTGTFFLGFDLPEFTAALSKKVFFVSQSRQRKVEGEILGSGCRKLLDISTQFFKQTKDSGIKINTTRNRHDSILGGHMIFVAETEKNWLLSQVTFFDSSRTDLFCKGFRQIAEVR